MLFRTQLKSSPLIRVKCYCQYFCILSVLMIFASTSPPHTHKSSKICNIPCHNIGDIYIIVNCSPLAFAPLTAGWTDIVMCWLNYKILWLIFSTFCFHFDICFGPIWRNYVSAKTMGGCCFFDSWRWAWLGWGWEMTRTK